MCRTKCHSNYNDIHYIKHINVHNCIVNVRPLKKCPQKTLYFTFNLRRIAVRKYNNKYEKKRNNTNRLMYERLSKERGRQDILHVLRHVCTDGIVNKRFVFVIIR